MPFTVKTAKANQKKGVEAKKKHQDDLWAYLSSGGARQYHAKLAVLADKEELTKPEQEFMDRVEKLFPYVKARKTDITTDGKELQPVLVKFLKDE